MNRVKAEEKIKPYITFDIIVKFKKTISCTSGFNEKFNQYLKDIGEKNKSTFLLNKVVKKMKEESGYKDFNELIKVSGLKDEEFMERFIEVLERMGLDIPRNKFSPEMIGLLNKEMDLYYKKKGKSKKEKNAKV